MKKNHVFVCVFVLGLLFLAMSVAADPYATLSANPAGACVQFGSEVTYTWTYGGDPDGWNYVEFDWDPTAMELIDHDYRCFNIFEDRVVCDQAGGFGGQPSDRFITLRIKESVASGTDLDVFGWAETNVGPWSSGKTTVKTTSCVCTGPSCVPEFPSAILPVTMIIGFLGVMMLIQRKREH